MKQIQILFFLIISIFNLMSQSRVDEAYNTKLDSVIKYFNEKDLDFPNNNIYWRAFKWNKLLELWAFSSKLNYYVKIKTYPICTFVGDLGPKRKEGDFQIPEGYYNIISLNPNSKYYLSCEIDYPNESDKILSDKIKPGGDIYMHGGCESIGCLAMTDDMIKEIYIINEYSMKYGQNSIPIHIYPTRLTINNFNKMKFDFFKNDINLLQFWTNLKEGYDYFEKYKLIPKFIVNEKGKYIFY